MARQPFPGLNNNVSDACEWTAWPNDSWRYSRKNSQKPKKRHILEAPSIPSRIFEQLKKKVLKIWVTGLQHIFLVVSYIIFVNPSAFVYNIELFSTTAMASNLLRLRVLLCMDRETGGNNSGRTNRNSSLGCWSPEIGFHWIIPKGCRVLNCFFIVMCCFLFILLWL